MRDGAGWVTVFGLALLTVAVLAGCEAPHGGSTAGVATDSAGVRIIDLPPFPPGEPVTELSIDASWSPSAGIEIGDLGDMAVVPGRGVLLLDDLAVAVLFLSDGGDLLARIGREGRGPGEFDPQGLSRIVATDSSVFVPDLFLQRMTEFALDGRVLHTRPFPLSPVYAVDWRRHPGGGLAFRAFEQFGDRIIRLEGTGLDTLFSSGISNDFGNLVLAPVTLWDLNGDGDVLFGRSDQGSVELRRGGSGELVWRTRWPPRPRELGNGEVAFLEDLVRESILRETPQISAELLARNLASIQYPDRPPVLAGILAAPSGEVWVRHARDVREMGREALRVGSAEGFGGPRWDVLDSEGFLRARVRLPERFTPLRFGEGWLYGILADEMGVERPARVGLAW